jgi:ATP-dependent Clp protease ATP-binding subunit ClpC
VTTSATLNFAWQLAAQEAVAARKEHIGPVQMFCGITKVADQLLPPNSPPEPLSAADAESVRAELAATLAPLTEQGIDLVTFRRALRARVGVGSHTHAPQDVVSRSPVLKALFDRAEILCGARGAVETRHLVAAMLEDRNLLVTAALCERHVDVEAVVRRLTEPSAARPQRQPDAPAAPSSRTPVVDRFGRDLTTLARSGALGPVVGRRAEVLQVMQTLLRKSKSNPVLVGEAGVGKTAIAELLAIRLAQRDAGELADRRVVELPLANLLAGASQAGEREKRLEAVVRECRENPHLILFIDELHTLVKAGGVGGAVDPADIFKPALARGEMRCVGATTFDEYARYIESDPALERRFARVPVVEPSAEEALEILRGIRESLEVHHGVAFGDEVLRAAVELSVRYDPAHHLPDKAIDLLDLAAARTRLPRFTVVGAPGEQAAQRAAVTVHSVAEVLAARLGIPPALLRHGTNDASLDGLAAFLEAHVVGQDAAAERLARRLKLRYAGLHERRGPLGVFLFLGPTGVGKTEMAKTLAQYLFGDQRSLTRIDCSEYMEEHSVAKLIGAPPGYVGHESQGQLTGALRSTPHSVVLFDEIDKAHPRVLDVLLQLFDEGRLTDAKGRTADARHAIFVMTGNATAAASHTIGFVPKEGSSHAPIARLAFRPELTGRIDEIIEFQPLTPEHVETLVARQLARIAAGAQQHHGIVVEVRDGVASAIARSAHSAQHGVRDLQRTIETLVEAPLAELLARGGGARAIIACVDGRVAARWAET